MPYGYWKRHPVILYGIYRDQNMRETMECTPLRVQTWYQLMQFERLMRGQGLDKDLYQVTLRIDGVSHKDQRLRLHNIFVRFKRFCKMRLYLHKLAKKGRHERFKRELVEKAWAPARVAKWVDAGVAIETL